MARMRKEKTMSDNKVLDSNVTTPRTYSEQEFKEVVAKRQEQKKLNEELQEKLKAYEEKERIANEEKARQTGELDKLLEAEKKARADAELKLKAENKDAELYRQYRQSVLTEVKKELGDRWLPEYETFSIESLSKISGMSIARVGVDVGKHQQQKTNDLEARLMEAYKRGDQVDIIRLKREMFEKKNE